MVNLVCCGSQGSVCSRRRTLRLSLSLFFYGSCGENEYRRLQPCRFSFSPGGGASVRSMRTGFPRGIRQIAQAQCALILRQWTGWRRRPVLGFSIVYGAYTRTGIHLRDNTKTVAGGGHFKKSRDGLPPLALSVCRCTRTQVLELLAEPSWNSTVISEPFGPSCGQFCNL